MLETINKLVEACEQLEKAVDNLLPGARHIPANIGLINDALIAGTRARAEARDALSQGAKKDLAFREASDLAMALWRKHYKDASPNFELCDSTAGVISQIDNMVFGLVKQTPVEKEKEE